MIVEYITLDDLDPNETARVNQYHVDAANRYVNRLIVTLGKDPETVHSDEDQQPQVSGLAMAKALYLAYASSIVGNDGDGVAKVKALGDELEDLEAQVSSYLYDRPSTLPISRG